MEDEPPRSISALRSDSPDSSLDSEDGSSEDSFVDQASVLEAPAAAAAPAPAAAAAASVADSTKTWGLDKIQKKQLIVDIIEAGGMYTFDIAKLIEEKPEYYDDCAAVPNRKTKTKNTIQYWKRQPAAYRKLLAEFGLEDKALGLETPTKQQIPRAATVNKPSASKKKTQPSKPSATKKPASDRTPRSNKSVKQVRSNNKKSGAPVLSQQLHQPSPARIMANNTATDFTTTLRLQAATTGNIRTANPESPEQNGGVVTILTVSDVPHNDNLRVSYVLAIDADMRYVGDSNRTWYRAFMHGENEVILQFPSLPYSDLFQTDGFARGRVFAKEQNDRHVLAETVLRNALLADETRQLTTVCFQFSNPLDNTIFSPNATGNRIGGRVIPDVPVGNAMPVRAKVFFPIAIYDADPPRINAPPAPSGDNPLADLVRAMNLGGNNNAGNNSPNANNSSNASNNGRPAQGVHSPHVRTPAPAPSPTAAPAPAPNSSQPGSYQSSLQRALGSSTEMIEFFGDADADADADAADEVDDDNDWQVKTKRDSDDDGGRAKRRAVLMGGQHEVWTIHHQDQEAADAVAIANEEASSIVAIHPITKECLTHKQVCEFVVTRTYASDEKMTVDAFVARLNQAGATTDQAVMDLLFPVDK